MAATYITKIAKFLPNNSIENEDIEQFIGHITGSERIKNLVLRSNGIKKRYYAINHKKEITHNNASLTYAAIRELLTSSIQLKNIELLSVGTSSPDQIMPSHAAMVHGLMGKNTAMEINTISGNCTSGMNALKYAFMNLQLGLKQNAIVTGSERMSSWMMHNKFGNSEQSSSAIENNPILAFNREFLRWMLSDGAAALLLENVPNPNSAFNLKIEWVDGISYANEIETCMYSGGNKLKDGSLKPWSDYASKDWEDEFIFAVKQDVKLLEKHIINKGVESLKLILEKHKVKGEEINHFLPHISSYFFKDKLMQKITDEGINIRQEQLFINLDEVGNVGAASIFIALEGLIDLKKVKKGDKILLSVPESARFNYVYALLTVC